MAISFTRPDPSSPSSVASASFTTARKGFETSEVREFLRMVAAELARLQERERFLERELRTSQRTPMPSSVALDEELVTKMLGEEAARILHTARDAAAQIKSRSEESAARLLREATDEAQRLREEAGIEAARRRADATADAESELEMAKQQGREMVNEARAYRERVLNELARRREIARQQIEQLVHGRDRLLQAFERSRLVAVDVMAELTPLGEPNEYVDLSPTTGPVPLMVPNMPRPGSEEPAPSARRRAEGGHGGDGADATVALTVPSRMPLVDGATSVPGASRPAAAAPAALDQTASADEDVDAAPDGPMIMPHDPDVTIFVDDDFDGDVVDDDVADDEAVDAIEIDAVEIDAVEIDAVEIDAVEIDAVEIDAVEVVALDGDVEVALVDLTVVADPADEAAIDEVAIDEAVTDETVADQEIAGVAAADDTRDDDHDDTVVQLDIVHHIADPNDDPHDDRPNAPVVALFAGEMPERQVDDAHETAREDDHPVHAGSPDELVAELDPTELEPTAATDDPAVEPVEPEVDPDATTMLQRSSADDLFARLRAARAESIAERAAVATTTHASDSPSDDPAGVAASASPVRRVRSDDSVFHTTPAEPSAVIDRDDTPFARREEALTPLILGAARKLKRVLADEQNEVLHALRRKEPVRDLAAMLPSESDQSDRYRTAVAVELTAAATAGAVSMGMSTSSASKEIKQADATRQAGNSLVDEIVLPLRDRLARCVTDADGDNTELASLVRLVYREWKSQRIDEHLDDVARAAFGRGALVGVAPGTRICWMVDPAGPECPDAEDNALAGAVPAGSPFPTDHPCAPAHSGCRCMIGPAD